MPFDTLAANADAKLEFFLTEEQHKKFASYLNREVNLPVFREAKEQQIFLKIIRSFDRTIYKFVPREYLDFVNSDSKISEELRDLLLDKLPEIIAKAVPLPFVPDAIKEQIIRIFLSVLIDVLYSATTIDERLDSLNI